MRITIVSGVSKVVLKPSEVKAFETTASVFRDLAKWLSDDLAKTAADDVEELLKRYGGEK